MPGSTRCLRSHANRATWIVWCAITLCMVSLNLKNKFKQTNTYTQHYDGVSFQFPIPPEFGNLYGKESTKIPLVLPNDKTPVCIRFVIHSGETLSSALKEVNADFHIAFLFYSKENYLQKSIVVAPGTTGIRFADPVYFEPVRAIVGRGVQFATTDRKVLFDEHAQDVVNDLKQPKVSFSRVVVVVDKSSCSLYFLGKSPLEALQEPRPHQRRRRSRGPVVSAIRSPRKLQLAVDLLLINR